MLNRFAEQREFFRLNPGVALDESVEPPAMSFHIEQWSDVIEQLKPLILLHWTEIDQTMPLRMNYGAYAALEKQGALLVCTARHTGAIVGYHVSVLRPCLHSIGYLEAYADIFYLKKEFRRGMWGYLLIKRFVEAAKSRGVKRIWTSSTFVVNLKSIYKRLGFKPHEVVFTKVFP